MTGTKRLGAQSRCFIAPIGTSPDDLATWKPLGEALDRFLIGDEAVDKGWRPARLASDIPAFMRSESDMKALEKQLTEQFLGYRPQRWITGIAQPIERSRPLGLTKEHTYTDNDGDTLVIEENAVDDEAIAWVSELDSGGFNVTAANAIPLALNVLGYDRPSAKRFEAGPTEYNGHKANRPIPSSQDGRDAAIAEAIDLLIGADIYDQRAAQRKSREAEQQERIKRKEDARAALKERMEAVVEGGISTISVETVQQAINEYKAAVDAVGAPSEL